MASKQKPFSSLVLENIHLSGEGSQKAQQLISQILQKYLSYHYFTCSINFLMNAFAESNSHAPTNKGNCRREANVLMATLSYQQLRKMIIGKGVIVIITSLHFPLELMNMVGSPLIIQSRIPCFDN